MGKKKDSAGGKISNLPGAGKGFQDALHGKKRRSPEDPDYMLGYMRGTEQRNRQQLARVKAMAERDGRRRPSLFKLVERLEGKKNDAPEKWFRPETPKAQEKPTPATPDSEAPE
jgi:hypothetical protein